MTGSVPLFPLRTALLSSALVALLGACAPDRDAADAAPTADTASAAASTDPATGSASAPTQPVDGAMSTNPVTDAAGPEPICNAENLQGLVGQQATETVSAQATADSGATSVRVLGPTDAATMDFREDRLNIHTDDAGVIERIGCG